MISIRSGTCPGTRASMSRLAAHRAHAGRTAACDSSLSKLEGNAAMPSAPDLHAGVLMAVVSSVTAEPACVLVLYRSMLVAGRAVTFPATLLRGQVHYFRMPDDRGWAAMVRLRAPVVGVAAEVSGGGGKSKAGTRIPPVGGRCRNVAPTVTTHRSDCERLTAYPRSYLTLPVSVQTGCGRRPMSAADSRAARVFCGNRERETGL